MAKQTKTFDAVVESRKWREATSRKLDAMNQADRLAYLKKVGERARLRAPHRVVPAA